MAVFSTKLNGRKNNALGTYRKNSQDRPSRRFSAAIYRHLVIPHANVDAPACHWRNPVFHPAGVHAYYALVAMALGVAQNIRHVCRIKRRNPQLLSALTLVNRLSVLYCALLVFSGAVAADEACVTRASSHYSVPAEQVHAILQARASIVTAQSGIGVMGIDPGWLPVLQAQGFAVERLGADACYNIAAGTWILGYSQRVEASLKNPLAGASKTLKARAERWQPVITAYARESGLSANLINAVIRQESGFNEQALSHAGAIGLMQLMPGTAKRMGVNPHDPVDNIRGGVAYLKLLETLFNGDTRLMLAAYNAGEGAVTKYGGIPPYKETQGYVKSILASLAYF